MDFQSLSRRELQSLCMSNGIKANMTNLAMADALKSLQTVITNSTATQTEPKSELPKAGRRAASSRHVGSARPHEPQGSPLPRSRRVTARSGSENLNFAADADTDEGKDKESVPETPKAPATRRRAQGRKEEVVESTIPESMSTRRRATKKEEGKTVGVTARRRTRKTVDKEDEDLDVAISIRRKSELKMADLGKDVVEEANNQSVEESGSTEEKEEKDIAQVLPIEQSKEEEEEEEEEKDVIEDTLSNDPSTEEETIRVQEMKEKEKDTIPDEQFSLSEENIDSKEEENYDEEKEQDDEERGEVSSDGNETYYQQEKLESSNELTQEEDMDDDVISEATEESSIKEANEEEGRREGTDVVLCLQRLSLSMSEVDEANSERTTPTFHKNLILEVGTEEEEEIDGSGDFDIDVPVQMDDFGNEYVFLSSLVNRDIPVKTTTEKFDRLQMSVSDNDKENQIGGDRRQKKIDPKTTMSLMKLKALLKESLINKKMEEKRSALKPLEENLLTTAKEDAVV